MKLLVLFALACACFAGNAAGRRRTSPTSFNVLHFGARADGLTDDSNAFMEAWKAACASSGTVRLHIPRGTYFVGPVKFTGPCVNVHSLTVYMKGYLKASTDLSKYVKGDDWIEIGWVDRLTLTGFGTFDGQGSVSWPYNNCPTKKNCKVLPTSIKFVAANNTVVRGITSVNNSPNTDGIHIERSSGVTIYSSVIGTGDDCISIGQGNSHVLLSGIKCGPGHGISVGSLGRYQNEGDVRGLVVRDCTLAGTTNGLRIKTWENSPGSSLATNMTFQNIVMKSVANPIIIDQTYCPYMSCSSKVPSRVKISDISFRSIRGTSTTPVAVTFRCSRGIPCQNINLHDVHLRYVGREPATAQCLNIKARYSGMQIPPPCK
uniref:Exopolygalacturonase-like n=1 Tax=Ananas comosus var. bracteatus TaxID=296719 RepID=A0A6V7P3H6_ANACO|nr:unnamed protein product [Ananas comosus var. bracteatus]